MKRFIKILCLALSVILIFATAAPAFAASESAEKCPMIYIPGIAVSRIYADKNDPSTELAAPDADSILSFVKEEFIPALIVFSADRDSEKLAGCVTERINTKYAAWFNNPDGSAKGNSGTRLVLPAKSAIQAGSTVRFDYDWRGNPLEIAAELKAFIEYVKVTGGYEKVALVPHSLGNVIALTYLSLFGYEDIQGVVFDTPAIDGVSYIGELFCGNMEFSSGSVITLLKFFLGENEYQALLTSIIDAFAIAGIPEMLSVFLNDIIDEIMPTIFKESLAPLCGRWLTIWSMTPDSYVDDAMDNVFNVYFKGEDSSVLKGKVTAFNEAVRKNKHNTLHDFDKNARVAVISRYGEASLPITPSWNNICDGVVDTKYSSLGATTAPVGEIFSDDYLKGKNMAYISPDKTVDASTCLFPEKTWFIKNLSHEHLSLTRAYYTTLLFAENEATADNFELARFSLYAPQTDTIVPDETVPEPAEKLSPFRVLLNFIKALLEKFFTLFK